MHFEALVNEAVGERPEHGPAMRVDIEVTRKRRNFVLVMQTRGASGDGRRELKARTCEELLATGAVVLSLALDSEALLSNELEHEVMTTAKTTTPTTQVTHRHIVDDEMPILHERDEASSTSRTDVSEALDTGLRLISMTEVGTLPRAALGLGVVASAHSGPYRVAFRLVRWAEQVQFVGTTDRRGGSFDLLSGSLHVCREFLPSRVPIGLCATGTLARISATGIADTPHSAVNVLGSAGIGIVHDVEVGPTHIRFHAEGAGQFLRRRYLINQGRAAETEVHRPSLLALRLGMSWGMSF